MTREEAIEILENTTFIAPLIIDVDTALNMAISALSAEPREDTISRQEVIELMLKYGFHAPDMTVTEFVEDILLPVQPKKGEWIPDHTVFTKCSCCGWYMRTECFKPYRPKSYHFCPNCGAKMKGGE